MVSRVDYFALFRDKIVAIAITAHYDRGLDYMLPPRVKSKINVRSGANLCQPTRPRIVALLMLALALAVSMNTLLARACTFITLLYLRVLRVLHYSCICPMLLEQVTAHPPRQSAWILVSSTHWLSNLDKQVRASLLQQTQNCI